MQVLSVLHVFDPVPCRLQSWRSWAPCVWCRAAIRKCWRRCCTTRRLRQREHASRSDLIFARMCLRPVSKSEACKWSEWWKSSITILFLNTNDPTTCRTNGFLTRHNKLPLLIHQYMTSFWYPITLLTIVMTRWCTTTVSVSVCWATTRCWWSSSLESPFNIHVLWWLSCLVCSCCVSHRHFFLISTSVSKKTTTQVDQQARPRTIWS